MIDLLANLELDDGIVKPKKKRKKKQRAEPLNTCISCRFWRRIGGNTTTPSEYWGQCEILSGALRPQRAWSEPRPEALLVATYTAQLPGGAIMTQPLFGCREWRLKDEQSA